MKARSDINNVLLSKSNIAICQSAGCLGALPQINASPINHFALPVRTQLRRRSKKAKMASSLWPVTVTQIANSLMRRHQLKGPGWQVGNAFFILVFFLYSSRGSHFHKIISRHVYMTLRREALGNYYSVWLNDSSAPYHLIGRHLAASSLNEQLVLID